MEALWEKAARRSHCDLLGLGNLLSQQFPQVWEELEDIWDQEMARCSVEFQSAVHVARMEQNTVPVGEPVR